MRFKIILAVLAIFSGVILVRYAMIMLSGGEIGILTQIAMPAVERGPILDRNGKILAIQTKLDSVTAWIPYVTNPPETARLLAEALDMNEQRLLERFQANQGFLYIKRKISPTERTRVQHHITEGKLEGISLEPEFGRNYPGRTLASHLIGYVGIDNIGLDGLEYTFNQELSPPVVGGDMDLVLGNQVFLSVDLSIQYALENIAAETLKSNNANSIMILVMEAQTGEMLGYASLPNYDPNIISGLTPDIIKNKPISLLYEPGSVFKVFSLATALELGGISPDSTFYCDGYYETTGNDGRKIRINCLGRHGTVSIEEILNLSCNAGAAYASDTVGAEEFHYMLRHFGFGEQTSIPLNGEEEGMLREPRFWSARSKPTIAIGQEISVTAMQIMKAATALANEGIILEPHIVKKIVSPDGKLVKEYTREPVKQLLSPATARTILNYMASATETGTGRKAALEGIRISTKTGTAQTIDPETGKYSETAFVASCLALFPTEDPQIIAYVVIESPRGEYYGGRIAAPVVNEVANFIVPYLGISRAGERVVEHSGRITIPQISLPEMKSRVPDFAGYSKRSLLPLLKRQDVRVLINGSGWVWRQDPPPGAAVKEGMTLTLELR
ncbi:MAG: PASTA domain-containing protein [Spirochaetales bacterium]|jgi:cell division protein FtsI (penicillin-binding protein 3)|nr:PASTA domain-containing protein [Spirochaetales bacterium]